jgi:ParB family chromosome partitioning protein
MARLLTKRRPPSLGWGWVKFEDDGAVIELELRALTLVGIIEG